MSAANIKVFASYYKSHKLGAYVIDNVYSEEGPVSGALLVAVIKVAEDYCNAHAQGEVGAFVWDFASGNMSAHCGK